MIGNTIKVIRELKQISQLALAEACSISNVHLNYVEKGKKQPSQELMQKLSSVLEVPLSILIFLSFDENEVNFIKEYKRMVPVVDEFLLRLIKSRLKHKL